MDRLTGAFQIKTVDFGQRIIAGWAAYHSNVDRVADIIEPVASQKAVARLADPSEVGVFIGHDMSRLPVGVPVKIEARPEGLYTETRIFEGPTGDDLLGAARGLMAAGRSLGQSIGYRVHAARPDRVNGKAIRRLLDYSLHEYSFAASQAIANPAALVVGVKATEGHQGKPYEVRKRGDRWVVVNPETGRVMGEHETEEQARRQQRALYVHVPDARGKTGGQMYRVKEMDGRWHVMRHDDDGKAVSLADFPTEDEARSKAEALNKEADGKTVLPNTLPDSAFLYVAPGGQKDDEGKTVPRSLRHFRYRDAEGAIDTEALRAVLASTTEAKTIGLDADELARLKTRARRMADAIERGRDPEADDQQWKAGAGIDLLTVAYGLFDLADRIAGEHKALATLGEGTKNGWRLQSESLAAVKALASDLGRLVEQAELVAAGKDEEALADWWRAQFELLEVS